MMLLVSSSKVFVAPDVVEDDDGDEDQYRHHHRSRRRLSHELRSLTAAGDDSMMGRIFLAWWWWWSWWGWCSGEGTIHRTRPKSPRRQVDHHHHYQKAMMAMASTLINSAMTIFCNRTRANIHHHQRHNYHRHYRDRCHHPILSRRWWILFVTLILISATHGTVSDHGGHFINHLNQSDYQSSSSRNPVKLIQGHGGDVGNRLPNVTNPHVFEGQVCDSIDIRNNVSQFEKLQNCTVVEGSLTIVLIDKSNTKDFENITFPLLREITDYLLLFRIKGLQSLAKMFPNLSVIRGRKLLHNYAFVIYEMLDLQEIGLKSLTVIGRGDVRIEKNPNLCFVDTIDWSRIARNFLISRNKNQNHCPNCPDNCAKVSAQKEDGHSIGDSYNRVCWTSDVCQKNTLNCTSDCEALNRTCSDTDHDVCCPDQCLGGCARDPRQPKNQICFSCKKFVYRNQCFDVCPKDSYAYLNRRCVTKDECHRMTQTIDGKTYKFKAFENECDYKCPVGYTEDPLHPTTCKQCNTTCPKVCPSARVSNIASAQLLEGCTTIDGSLEITINAQIIEELERNLKDLVIITEYLKIVRSSPLITLNFLRNLRVIEGKKLDRNSYSFLVMDNPNLQDLWTFDQDEWLVGEEKRLKILRGRIFIHLNAKLCHSKIENMLQYTEIVEMKSGQFNDTDVSSHTNGDRIHCNFSKLNVEISQSSSKIVIIVFESFKKKMADPRSLLEYLIYYREAPHQNVTIFDGRNGCSDNEWKILPFDAANDDEPDKNVSHLLTNLKPYTQYALYIETYTIDTATAGARSDIIYFKTLPDTPSQPLNLFAKANKHNEIFVKWDPPSRPNGEVTHYIVIATQDESDSRMRVHRDFCTESITKDQHLVIHQNEPMKNFWLPPDINIKNYNNLTESNLTTVNGDPQQECCSCNKKNETTVKIKPSDVEQSITFEDYIINTVYIKRQGNDTQQDDQRQKRHAENGTEMVISGDFMDTISSTLSNIISTDIPQLQNTTTVMDESKWQFEKIVHNQQHVVIPDLVHYTGYTIEVKACQDPLSPSTTKSCSVTAIISVKTLPLAGADDIKNFTYTSANSTSDLKYKKIHLKWEEPSQPNGFILSYQLEYRSLAGQEPAKICVTRELYQQNDNGHTLVLFPGNYSVRVRARSLANYGNWTDPLYIFIEDPPNPIVKISILVTVIVIFLLSLAYLLYHLIKVNQAKLQYYSVNPDYHSAGFGAYQPDPKWEIPREKISLINELGEGSFGKVYEGKFLKNKIWIRCAVKTLNETATDRDRINFLKEADVMKSFTDCHHVVKLLGICSKSQPYYVLMEIMTKGDLRNYLRNNRPDNPENPDPHPPTLAETCKMAIEIADGMAYLASKKFVHRDLAARNCMLSEDLTVKIGDFGMTRDICESDYYRKGGKGLLPVRWMSPESLKDGVFTTYSDVWAYGVVLWEIVTLAPQPYQGLSNEDVLKFVTNGNHMEKPQSCPDFLWRLMVQCWQQKPKQRPTFPKIIQILLSSEHVDQKAFLAVSYYSPGKFDTDANEKNFNAENGNPANNNKDELLPLNDPSLCGDDVADNDDNSDYSSDSSTDDQLPETDTEFRCFPTILNQNRPVLASQESDDDIVNENELLSSINIDVMNGHGRDRNSAGGSSSTSSSLHLEMCTTTSGASNKSITGGNGDEPENCSFYNNHYHHLRPFVSPFCTTTGATTAKNRKNILNGHLINPAANTAPSNTTNMTEV